MVFWKGELLGSTKALPNVYELGNGSEQSMVSAMDLGLESTSGRTMDLWLEIDLGDRI